MNILGLTAPLSWNPAAAIIKNGKLIAAVEEERFVGVKHAPRMLPLNAIEYCLKAAKISTNEVDIIAFGYKKPISAFILSSIENIKERDFIRIIREGGAFAEYLVSTIRLFDWFKKEGFRTSGKNKLKIRYYPHHLAHAASAFRASGFDSANIITLDGQGEDDSGGLWTGQNGVIKKIEKIGHHQGLGWIYGETTDVIGFTPHSGEGKTMGLAAYGKRKYDWDKMWHVNKNAYKLKSGWNKFFWKEFGPRRTIDKSLTQKHKNIAQTSQAFLEKAGISLSKKMFSETGIRNFALAGGVALNCDMNAKIFSLPFVKNIFIQPAAHDAGTALGAALQAAFEAGEKADFTMNHSYLGPEYTNSEIKKVLIESKLKFERVDNIEEVVTPELVKGKIIGWFQGKAEFGPRALGARSILAHPGHPGLKDKINKSVKHRESWRPFAPSILDEAGSEYFDNYCFNPFMTLTFQVKINKRRKLSQAIHVDNTARIQSVIEKTNPRYFGLIKIFAKKTGIPALLNTSFNDQGKPIVLTPKDALACFYSTGIDILAIGDFIVRKV